LRDTWLRWKESYTSFFFVLPAIVYIAYFSILPTLTAVYDSFQTPTRSWVLSNYQGLEFFGLGDAVINTMVVSFGALAFQFLLAFIVAEILTKEFRGKKVFTTIFIIPWGVATVVAAFSFSNIFTTSGGYMNSFMQLLGIQPVNWYSNYAIKVVVLIISDAWKNTPIVALILLAGMTGISEQIYHAAAVDGAGPVRRFLYITLPNLRNFIIIALIIRGISEFNIFALPLVLVGYNPVLLTTLAYEFYSTTSSVFYSYAASTVLLAFVLAFALVAVRFRRSS
jgi:ABC-type sugar transport system permease subunit